MFWQNFEKLCALKGSKPNPIAAEIGIGSATITKWKNGTIPNGETLIKVADYFNVSVDYLLGLEDDTSICNAYRSMFSDKGIDVIHTMLSDIINLDDEAQLDELSRQVGLDFADLKQFLTDDRALWFKTIAKLDKLLLALDTNVYNLFNEYFAQS